MLIIGNLSQSFTNRYLPKDFAFVNQCTTAQADTIKNAIIQDTNIMFISALLLQFWTNFWSTLIVNGSNQKVWILNRYNKSHYYKIHRQIEVIVFQLIWINKMPLNKTQLQKINIHGEKKNDTNSNIFTFYDEVSHYITNARI